MLTCVRGSCAEFFLLCDGVINKTFKIARRPFPGTGLNRYK